MDRDRRDTATKEPAREPAGGSKDKLKALDVALSHIDRQFGKGSIMRLGESGPRLAADVIPTGAIALDIALGIGGIPRGRVTEIFGPEASGKTTIVQHIIAEAQKTGGLAAFIDAEHALDAEYAKRCGVNIDELYVSQPDTGEQALEIVEALVRSNALDIVAIDSVAALVPKSEIDGEMGDSHPGAQARLMSQALRKLTGAINRSKTAVVFTNQLRQKIGVMFGNPETTPGGLALKFYASVRLDVRRIETLKQGGESIGNRTRVRVVKNKMAPPFRSAEFDIMYGQGISREGGILDIGVEASVIRKSGSFFSFGDTRMGQGREQAREFLRTYPEITLEIESQIRANKDKLAAKNTLAVRDDKPDDEAEDGSDK
jgi:recombination protein RecA